MYDPAKPYKKQILEIIQRTWDTPYVSVSAGTYPLIRHKLSRDEFDIDHTDGIGTKGFYHWQQRSFSNAAIDALAMNLNDLAIMRATPYKLSNHIMIPQDDREAIIRIVETLADECVKRKIAMTGGETSMHDNIRGMDISITLSGFIQKPIGNLFKAGDALIGMASNGLHSNGFTKVREKFGDEFRPEFIEPTRIYLEEILELNKEYDIHGMMHITGGAYTKLKDLLPGLDAAITRHHSLEPQEVFDEIFSRGVSDEDMYRTFNCGIGFILGMDKSDANKLISENPGYEAIGEVVEGTGRVRITSMFSGKQIEY
ncbi:MAG: AIR synthase-related protein [Nanoarchaeota archaeon]